MIAEATLTEYSVAAQIHAVAQAAYALEAERIGCTDFPPVRESLQELERSSDRFLVFRQSGVIVGVLSFIADTDSVVITRLVVSPAHLRQGIATALLAELERRLPAAIRLTVSTAQANGPAVSLYRKLGYGTAGVSGSPEGIPLLHLAWALHPSMWACRFIGSLVEIQIDRPLGSRHPEHGFEYPVNYGYLAGEIATDGEALDTYVLGVTAPLESFSGRCIAVIHRLNDDDDKLVVVPDGVDYSDEDIRLATRFQEQFFESMILRTAKASLWDAAPG